MQRTTCSFIKNKKNAKTAGFFYKERKRMRERFVLLKRMQKNARTLRSFEKNVWPALNFLNFEFEYLRENEFLSKTILACLSWSKVGLIHEKNRGQKFHETASLIKSNIYTSLQMGLKPINYITCKSLKGQCHKIFCHFFIS